MRADTEPTTLPIVAVVGRPNVGKSSLVNRVLGKREAIVEATPGVTRDRHSFIAGWGGRIFEILDTGGLELGARGLEERVQAQAQLAIEAADVVLFVVDAHAGPLEDDAVVARQLRRSAKPVLVVANKVDDPSSTAAAEFHRLGLGDPFSVSALHGTGSGDLLDELVRRLPDRGSPPGEDWGAIAIIGRPNVGKSSILNGLLGDERAIVHPEPGTTRDPVDSHLWLSPDRRLRIVDTAGIRRQVRVEDPVEYFSLLRSRRTLARVDGAVLVVDASEGVTSHDQRMAQEIVDHGRACVVALNKWDLVPTERTDRERFERAVRERLRFVPWASLLRTSALTRRGLKGILPAVESALESHRRRIPTAQLNRIVLRAQEERPHPRSGGRAVRILYAVQARIAPPTVLLFVTRPLEDAYVRYIERRIRAVEAFAGSPIAIDFRLKREKGHA